MLKRMIRCSVCLQMYSYIYLALRYNCCDRYIAFSTRKLCVQRFLASNYK